MEPDDVPRHRRIHANRTLNLRAMRAVGYDMDYTLVPYFTDEWERAAFEHALDEIDRRGWPAAELRFEPDEVTQGLVFDLELGNLVKATRFGYVIRACHGTRPLAYDELRAAYSGTSVDLSEPRWEFTNTMFSLSQSSLYGQLVDHLDAGRLPGVVGYGELHQVVGAAIDAVHVGTDLKPGILADPERFIDPDPHIASTLTDQRRAGKRVLLITNSDWDYTREVMRLAVEPFVPAGTTWRELFDIVIVSARKPSFFTSDQAVFRIIDEDRGTLMPHHGPLLAGEAYVGGGARLVEESLGLTGDELLYVGDHLFGDVHVTKITLRWRTALIVRELEEEILDAEAFEPHQRELVSLMAHKAALERQLAVARLDRLRAGAEADDASADGDAGDADDARDLIAQVVATIAEIDDAVAPLARASAQLTNPRWGPIMRAGLDKSLFARQVERYADVYTSRASNLGLATPFAYLRAPRSDLPHDPR